MSITLRKQLHVAAQQAGFHLAMANMHVTSITLRKELHVAAQQASFHLAMANMHVMYDTQRACSPSLITRNVDHFEKRAARGRPASQLSLSDGQYARDV